MIFNSAAAAATTAAATTATATADDGDAADTDAEDYHHLLLQLLSQSSLAYLGLESNLRP